MEWLTIFYYTKTVEHLFCALSHLGSLLASPANTNKSQECNCCWYSKRGDEKIKRSNILGTFPE